MEIDRKKITSWIDTYSSVAGQKNNLEKFREEVANTNSWYDQSDKSEKGNTDMYMRLADHYVNVYNMGITKCNESTNQKLPFVDKFELTPCVRDYVDYYYTLTKEF
jgi:hypothetical protein